MNNSNYLIKHVSQHQQYNAKVQNHFLNYMLSDAEAAKIVMPYAETRYFHAVLQQTMNFIHKYYGEHQVMPSHDLVTKTVEIDAKAKIEVKPEPTSDLLRDAFTREFERFCNYKSYSQAITDSAKMTELGNYHDAQKLMTEAQVSFTETKSPFKILLASQTDQVQPPSYIIKPWLMADTLTSVYGPSRSYKSFWCLEAALRIATGGRFNGWQCRKGGVFYVAGEGDTAISMRIEAWKTENPNVKIDDKDMVVVAQPIPLLEPAEVSKLIAFIKSHGEKTGVPCSVVFIDTLSQCMAGGDEDAAGAASLAISEMIRIRRELNCTVVFVHHTGKDKSRGMRGSSAFFANVDACIELERDGITKDSETTDQTTARAIVAKMKDGKDGDEITFGCRLVKIPKFAGYDLDGSLVVDFTMEPVAGEDKQRNKEIEKAEKLEQKNSEIRLATYHLMQENKSEKMSVTDIIISLGWSNNGGSREKLAKAIPLLMRTEVRDDDQSLGFLKMVNLGGAMYGEVILV